MSRLRWQTVALLALLASLLIGATIGGGSGLPGAAFVGDSLRVSARPYIYSIAEGEIPGHDLVSIYGERSAVAVVAAGSDVWGGAATLIPTPDPAGEQLVLVSTAGADDAGSTGVTSVIVYYLTPAWAAATETVITDGTTPVNMAYATVAYVNGMHADTVGTGGSAAGVITLYKTGSAATVYSRIGTGYNSSDSSRYRVPAGRTLYLTGGLVTATSSKPTDVRLLATVHDGALTGVLLTQHGSFLQDSGMAVTFPAPIKIPAGGVVLARAWTAQAGADVSVSFGGWEEDE